MTRVAVVLSLVVALVAGSVATATAASAPGGPSAEVAAKARAKSKSKKKAKKKAKKKKAKAKRRAARGKSVTGLRDGRYKWSLPGSSTKYDLVVSGNGARVSLSYIFFRYGSSGGECVPTKVTFKDIKVNRDAQQGILRFKSGEVKVGAVQQDGVNGGIAYVSGELWVKQRSFNLNLAIRLRNHNDRASCFEFPSGDGKLG